MVGLCIADVSLSPGALLLITSRRTHIRASACDLKRGFLTGTGPDDTAQVSSSLDGTVTCCLYAHALLQAMRLGHD